jgi:hypothetical protein
LRTFTRKLSGGASLKSVVRGIVQPNQHGKSGAAAGLSLAAIVQDAAQTKSVPLAPIAATAIGRLRSKTTGP